MEEPCCPTKNSLDVYSHFGGGVNSERAGARPADLFQQQQKRRECVSRVRVSRHQTNIVSRIHLLS